jgi:hypothetical protein
LLRNGLRSAHSTGLKIDDKVGRPFRLVAGPTLSPTAFRLATLPLDPELAARLDRAHADYFKARAEAKRAATATAVIRPRDWPIDMLGGYRVPGARRIDLSPMAAPGWATPSRWKPTGDGAGVPPIPDFLRRHPNFCDAVAALRSAA